MPVKKLSGVGSSPKRVTPRPMSSLISGLELPSEAKSPAEDLRAYTIVIYGRPGIGKTTFLTSIPGALMLSCERVSRGIPCFDFNAENGGVTDWTIFRRAVELLEADKSDRFRTVAVDTAAAAYAQCMDCVCREHGIAHPQDEGYGKGWNAVRDEFIRQITRIRATGRSVAFSAHSREVEIEAHSGGKFTRIQPTLSGQLYEMLQAISDFILFAEYVKDTEDQTLRVLITQGDEIVDAKRPVELPLYIPLVRKNGWSVLEAAFRGEDVGLDPRRIRAARTTSKASAAVIGRGRSSGELKKP